MLDYWAKQNGKRTADVLNYIHLSLDERVKFAIEKEDHDHGYVECSIDLDDGVILRFDWIIDDWFIDEAKCRTRRSMNSESARKCGRRMCRRTGR